MTTGSTTAAITALAAFTLLHGPAAASAQTVPGGAPAASADSAAALSQRVEVVRTEYGIPHIFADDWKAFGFAMAWVQSEDYGSQTAIGLVKDRGVYGRHVGRDSIGGDFAGREAHAVAVVRYPSLEPRSRAVYEGFAEGVNEYARQHPGLFPEWLTPDFTGIDAFANDVYIWSRGDAARFVRAEERRAEEQAAAERGREGASERRSSPERALAVARPPLTPSWAAAEAEAAALDPALDGSNAWALHGSRTTSGRTILLRNPHLSWTAGYYEAHVRIGDELDFYGDFRIGGAFGIIGGFNRHLGWATTNNSPVYSQVYALPWHSSMDGHVVMDGQAVALTDSVITVDWTEPDGRSGWVSEVTPWSPWGPVIHEDAEYVYVLTDPRDGQYRRGEQLVRMMSAESLDEWLEVMRMRAHASSNFTYADVDGNIALYYNARIPDLPHEPTGDSAAVATSASDMWRDVVTWERLPLYVNPPGGYVQQANDTPDFINLNVTLDRDTVAQNLPDPRLRLRSQLSFALVHGDDRLSLEDVVERKHSPRMLAAERMVDDLLAAIDASEPTSELGRARRTLGAWDRTAAAESRGGVLFKAWFDTYIEVTDTLEHRVEWDSEAPASTPVGIGRPGRALAALRMAMEDLAEEGIAPDARWGDVHRVVRGDVDEPVSGCEGGLGCFRTLSFTTLPDGRRAANRGDGWVFAVEFGEVPRGYSVLAYGQSRLEESPHHDDQAAMFARGEMKPILWTDADIEGAVIRRYRPGAR
jgi:acyl-homoserine-lactone acylase